MRRGRCPRQGIRSGTRRGEQARLKEMHGITQGVRTDLTSDMMSEVTQCMRVSNERQAERLNQLNKLIPPLQALVSASSDIFPPPVSCLIPSRSNHPFTRSHQGPVIVGDNPQNFTIFL